MAKRVQPSADSFEDMHFPLAGIDLSMGFDRQPPRAVLGGTYSRTTPIGQNVRAFDVLTSRARGGQRPGLAKYIPAVVNNASLVQELNVVVGVGYTSPGKTAQSQATPIASTGGASSLTSAFPSAVVAGDGILVFVTSHGGTFPTSVTDTKGNTYTRAVGVTNASDGVVGSLRPQNVSVWYSINVLGGSGFSVTVNYAASMEGSFVAFDIPGLLSLDQTNSSTGSSSPATTGLVTTTGANEIAVIVAESARASGSSALVPPAGWTDLGGSVSQFPTDFAYQVFGSVQSNLSATWTAPGNWAACIATFKITPTASQASQSGRIVSLVAVQQGNVYVSPPGAAAWTPATNTTGKTLITSGVVRSTANNQKLWFADGKNYLYYDPSSNNVLAWSASAGQLPVDSAGNTPRLICTWRGRMVLSGLLLDGQNWFMSAVGDPTNWNYFPFPVVTTQAVAGNNSPLGSVGDVITSLIPYSDDVLIFGGDHTIWMLRGDPMAGGQINLVSDIIGMAWGSPWCKGPDGTLYFFTNKTGIYTMTPGSPPVRFSQPIEQLISNIDTGANIIRLQWDDLWQGLHVYITPAAAASSATHLFWEQRTGAWWTDVFTNPSFNPLCCCTFDGNTTADRHCLIGSWDGYVRTMTPTAYNDDGYAIQSGVLIGPLVTKDFDDIMLKDIQGILASGSQNVQYAVYVGSTPEIAIGVSPARSGTFSAGRNLTDSVRRAGHAIWVLLTGIDVWAMEAIRCQVTLRGKVRRRGH